MEPVAAAPDRVLVLCTANQCRSPLAGSLLRREVERRGLRVEVLTAGLGAPGRPATPPTVEAAENIGLDLRDHQSRKVDKALLAGADLVLGMERLHVREAVVLDPPVWRRAFTLREAVRRAEAEGPRSRAEPLRVWCSHLSAGRDRMSLMGASTEDDVRDPTSDWSVDHATTASDLAELVQLLVTYAWPA
jgi:protein-tyrosine-phosphatase